MRLVQLLLPLTDAQGAPFPPALFQAVRAELTTTFGGLTAYTRAPAEGLWTDGAGRTVRDQVVVLEVMVDALDAAWWTRYRRELEARFRQDLIVVRAQEVELL